MTTVCACEKTVVMVKQPGHLTSMKKDRGAGTRFWRRSKSANIFPLDLTALITMIEAYLELVLAGLSSRRWVEKIDGENLDRQHHVSI